MSKIRRSMPKVDNKDKLSGQAKYVNDYLLDEIYYAKTVRSIHPHANIISIKIPPLEDGYFIIDHTHIPKDNVVHMIFDDWKVFADNKVNYIGEPILIVIGQDRQKIADIIKHIEISYEILTPTFDHSDSAVTKNYVKGNYENIKAIADHIITETFETGYQEQAYIEPQGFICYPETEDKITLIGSIQCPYYVKKAVERTLGYQDDQVRVIQAAVGGAFGGKEEYPSVIACQLAVAVHHLQVPIKMIFEREEDMVSTTKRHPSKITMEAVVKDNKVFGIKAHVAIDGGAYVGLSGVVLSRAMIAVTSAYTIDHLEVSGDVYRTNTVPTGAFRGFGAPQMIFATEMFMHHIADHLKIDHLSLRRSHLAKQNDQTSTSGTFRDPIIMDQLIKKTMDASNYIEKRKSYPKEKSLKGIGMSWFLHGCGFTGSGESDHIHAKVKLKKDLNDRVHLLIASTDMGQGAFTSLKKIVIETLEIPDEQVIFNPPDTDFVVDSGPTVASRTIMIVGGLLAKAAQKLKKNWIQGQTQEIIEHYEQPEYITWDEQKMNGDAYPAYSWGVNIVEVEVSKVTYQVDIKHIWSAYDIGHAIDERMSLGQADGGILQGVAYGYLEVMAHDQGKLKQKNMTDYIIPTALDAARTTTFFIDNPYHLGPFGAKGLGELSLVGGAPAVALAIEHAIGIPINKIPATPEMIMELIHHETD
jgi:CO/xanthine dehydrogenase Mo-binding subunit